MGVEARGGVGLATARVWCAKPAALAADYQLSLVSVGWYVVSCCVGGGICGTPTLVGCGVFVVHQSSVYCSVSSCCTGGIGLSPFFCCRGESRLDMGMKGRGLFECHRRVGEGRAVIVDFPLVKKRVVGCSGGVRCVW